MLDWEKECIKTNLARLCDTIDLKNEKILISLKNADVFTKEDKEQVEVKFNTSGVAANYRMLDLLMSRVNGYEQLMKSLKDANQTEAYNILLKCKNECGHKSEENEEEEDSTKEPTVKDWERECITKNKLALCKAITLEGEGILIALENEGVFTGEDSDLVKLAKGRMAANNKMLDLIVTRSNGYSKLMKILKDLNQDKAYNILEKCKTECELKSECKTKCGPKSSTKKRVANVPSSSATTSKAGQGKKRKVRPEDEADGPEPIENVVVKKPDAPMSFSDDHYRLPTKEKGLALIINVIKYNKNLRDSAKRDTKNLTSLFSEMNYEIYNDGNVLQKERWNADDIKKTVEKFRDRANKPGVASILVVVEGHGKNGKVIGSDGKRVLIWKHILNQFNTENCEQLQDKPKLFFIQACQFYEDDDEDDDIQEDEEDEDQPHPPNFDHYGLVTATIPGFPAKRNLHIGSVMIHYMTEILMENARQWSFQKMVKELRKKVQEYKYAPKKEDVKRGKFIGGQTITADILGLETLYFNLEPENH